MLTLSQVQYAEDIFVVSGLLCEATSALNTHSLLGIQALSTQGHHPYFSLRVREFLGISHLIVNGSTVMACPTRPSSIRA